MSEYRKERWKLMTAAEAYPLCGYRTAKAFRLAAQQGLIPRVMIGRSIRFDPDALRAWAASGGTPLRAEDGEARDQVESLATTP